MNRLLASLVLVIAACGGAQTPSRTPAADTLAGYALQPINETGEMSMEMYDNASVSISLGLAVRDNKHAKVVRLTERQPNGGWKFVELFAIPTEIAGVPSNVRGFDYSIDARPRASEVAVPGVFRAVAYASAGKVGYTTTWTLRLDEHDKLHVAPPVTTTRELGTCEACD